MAEWALRRKAGKSDSDRDFSQIEFYDSLTRRWSKHFLQSPLDGSITQDFLADRSVLGRKQASRPRNFAAA